MGQAHRALLGAGFFDRATPLSVGPANPQALNRYAYVLNNPVRYTDPTGHGQVTNESEDPILIYGSRTVEHCDTSDSRCTQRADGTYRLDRAVGVLQPGQKSEDLGYDDVDGIIERVDTDSDGVTRVTGYRVFGDRERLTVTGRDENGQLLMKRSYGIPIVDEAYAWAVERWNGGRRERLPMDHLVWRY